MMENPLQENGMNPNALAESKIQVRVPKRIIHCSDGVIEEFSDDETDGQQEQIRSVDPKTLTWGPWVMHYTWAGGNKVLEYCDYVGETLAEFFHITTPKYQLEISEYERQEAANKKAIEESAGWTTTSENGISMVTIQPSPTNLPNKSSISL